MVITKSVGRARGLAVKFSFALEIACWLRHESVSHRRQMPAGRRVMMIGSFRDPFGDLFAILKSARCVSGK
jgi:hypothetical protein